METPRSVIKDEIREGIGGMGRVLKEGLGSLAMSPVVRVEASPSDIFVKTAAVEQDLIGIQSGFDQAHAAAADSMRRSDSI